MRAIPLLLLLLPLTVFANFAEFFGPGSKSSSLANQSTFCAEDAENNYYAPAFFAFTDKMLLNVSSYYVDPTFKPIENTTTINSVNHDGPTSVSTDYQESKILSAHLVIPLIKRNGSKLGISVTAPINHLQVLDTGDGLNPEYVMYRSRYERTSIIANLALPINNNWAISAGTYVGYQVSGDSFLLSGTNGGPSSNGQLQLKIEPSLALLLSTAVHINNHSIYLAFQQEMKSNFQNHIHGEAAPPISLLYNFEMKSLMYYDPMIIRTGYSHQIDQWKLLASMEYQFWEHYKTPNVTIHQNNGQGIVNSSGNYETIKPQNIFVPKVGIQYQFTDRFNLRAGTSYRPTPLSGDFSSSGNSVDTDSMIFAIGGGYSINLFEQKMDLSLALQHHKLKTKKVTKSTANELGNGSENKIGSPGYTIGGKINSISLGLNLQI